MSIFPVIVVTMSTLTLLFGIIKYCLKWNIFGGADGKPATKLTIIQKTKVVSSAEPEHKSQIEPCEANQENEEVKPKESPHLKRKTVKLSTEKNESFASEENKESRNLSPNVTETNDIIEEEEESLSSDHELELSPSKRSSITTKKIPKVPTEIPVPENHDSEQLLECKTSSVSELESDSNDDEVDPNDKAITRWRKPVAIATKDTVPPKTTVKTTLRKPTIELPSPIYIGNNNSATKKKKKLFSLTPQKSEIFSPVEVESSETDPRNVVMKQLRNRQHKRK